MLTEPCTSERDKDGDEILSAGMVNPFQKLINHTSDKNFVTYYQLRKLSAIYQNNNYTAI
jgi:hypothetical protein